MKFRMLAELLFLIPNIPIFFLNRPSGTKVMSV